MSRIQAIFKKLRGLFSKKKKGKRKSAADDLPKKSKWAWRFKFLLLLFMIGLGVLIYYTWDLPSINTLTDLKKTPSIIVKAEDGTMLGTYGDVYGDYLPLKDMPKHLVDAALATEDRNFYYHFGVDPKGLLRAIWANYRAGRVVQGGSTITQQLAKNLFLSSDRTMRRKIQEAILALKLEWHFTKDEILTLYLNRVYLGAGNFGVDAASRRYFTHSARTLNIGESAMLMGLLKAPSKYAPTNNPELSEKRAWQVLINMVDADMLTKAQADEAREQLIVAENFTDSSAFAPYYFADWVVDTLPDYIGEVTQDIVVTTTLDPKLQEEAAKIISKQLDDNGDKLKVSQSALLSMKPDGTIKVMIGGRNYRKSQYNRVTQALRQPGSSFKPFVYLAGIEAGFMPDSLVEDKPITIGRWTPKNYTGRYEGIMTMRDALAQSINTVAVQVSEAAGRNHVIDVATRLGITSHMEPVPSIALGSTEVSLLEMTGAYAHFANKGEAVTPYGIKEIRTAKENNILYSRESSGLGQVFTANQMAMMNNMLAAVVQYGTGGRANIGRSQAGKTGTTSDYKDAWFIGYTPDMVTGVWVGNDDNSQMKKVTGGNLPASIWKEYMKLALKDVPLSYLPTQISVDTDQSLPWLNGTVPPRNLIDTPVEDGAVQGEDTDAELSKGFWDKLFDSEGGGEAKPEYTGQ
jgi:penicillin-binding protein 1A